MSLPSFFVDAECRQDDQFFVTGEENRHLAAVLRLKPGEQVEIMPNDGYIHRCELVSVSKTQSVAAIRASRFVPKRSQITLYMALIMADRMDWVVQKATELGVERIVPFVSEFCTVKDKGNKADRLHRICVSAAKQSGRATVPQISKTLDFYELCSELKTHGQVVLAYEEERQNAKAVLPELDRAAPIGLVVGPEGGFCEAEAHELIACGARSVSLGSNILRAETAGVALISAINYELGLWEKIK